MDNKELKGMNDSMAYNIEVERRNNRIHSWLVSIISVVTFFVAIFELGLGGYVSNVEKNEEKIAKLEEQFDNYEDQFRNEINRILSGKANDAYKLNNIQVASEQHEIRLSRMEETLHDIFKDE